MGCFNSKIDSVEDVARCKARKELMEEAVSHRHAFAAAHAMYMQAIKNMGAALSQFAETELCNPSPPPPSFLPPPRPSFLHTPSFPRSQSVPTGMLEQQTPALALENTSSTLDPDGDQLECDHQQDQEQEDQEEEEEDQELGEGEGDGEGEAESMQDEQQQQEVYEGKVGDGDADTMNSGDGASVDETEVTSGNNKELVAVPTATRMEGSLMIAMKQVDDKFLNLYAKGMEVGTILEARKVHYQFNFVSKKGFYDPSWKLLNVISWGHLPHPPRRPKNMLLTMPLAIKDGNVETEDYGAQGKHAALLDRLLAWEKKLYSEVKIYEIKRLKHDSKLAELRQLESKGIEVGLDRLKSDVELLKLETTVARQAVETAYDAIAKLRDEELYFQLADLVNISKGLWQQTLLNHTAQTEILSNLPTLYLQRAIEATCKLHMTSTEQLESSLNEWRKAFKALMPSLRKYLENLNGWLRVCLTPLETISGQKSGQQSNSPSTPLYRLCLRWHETLERLPDDIVLQAFDHFTAKVHRLIEVHKEEHKHKTNAKALEKQFKKQQAILQNYEDKYRQTTAAAPEEKRDFIDEPLPEQKKRIEELKKKMEEENQRSSEALKRSRELTGDIFSESGLLSLLRAFETFSNVCFHSYKELQQLLPPSHIEEINRIMAGNV